MNGWMRKLKAQHERMRERYPGAELLVAFDIDTTILDRREMIRWILLDFDLVHGSGHFHGLKPEDISTDESQLGALLRKRGLFHCVREQALEWYYRHRGSREALLASHHPYQGVMELIRWFQTRPGTRVGLMTGGPDSTRQETLQSLNAVEREYGVVFAEDLLFMNPRGWGLETPRSKVEGLRYFQSRGYRVFAVVDGDLATLDAMVELARDPEILFVQANHLIRSEDAPTPYPESGDRYDTRELVSDWRQTSTRSLA